MEWRKKTTTGRQRETFGSDRHVYCGDDYMCIYISQITILCMLIICSQFYISYTWIKLEGKVFFLGQQRLFKKQYITFFFFYLNTISHISQTAIQEIIKFIQKYKCKERASLLMIRYCSYIIHDRRNYLVTNIRLQRFLKKAHESWSKKSKSVITIT